MFYLTTHATHFIYSYIASEYIFFTCKPSSSSPCDCVVSPTSKVGLQQFEDITFVPMTDNVYDTSA